jgi:hypothetical protein
MTVMATSIVSARCTPTIEDARLLSLIASK